MKALMRLVHRLTSWAPAARDEELLTALRGLGRTVSHDRERHRSRHVLVVVQVALALVLLIGSGLMIRTFQHLRSVWPGFTHPEEIQILHAMIPGATSSASSKTCTTTVWT